MCTLIVLTNFSDTSLNAARYAVSLGATLPSCRIILLHAYPFIDHAPPMTFNPYSEESIREESIVRLTAVKQQLETLCSPGPAIACRAERAPLVEAVNSLALNENASFVVLGSRQHPTLDRFFFGSNAIDLIEECPFPLLAIQETVRFKPIERTVFACELKNIAGLPAAAIVSLVALFRSKLFIINVDPHKNDRTGIDKIAALDRVHEAMADLEPEYLYLNGSIPDEIAHACDYLRAGLLILVHKKHSAFFNVFRSSVSRELAIGGRTPVLILKEVNQEVYDD